MNLAMAKRLESLASAIDATDPFRQGKLEYLPVVTFDRDREEWKAEAARVATGADLKRIIGRELHGKSKGWKVWWIVTSAGAKLAELETIVGRRCPRLADYR